MLTIHYPYICHILIIGILSASIKDVYSKPPRSLPIPAAGAASVAALRHPWLGRFDRFITSQHIPSMIYIYSICLFCNKSQVWLYLMMFISWYRIWGSFRMMCIIWLMWHWRSTDFLTVWIGTPGVAHVRRPEVEVRIWCSMVSCWWSPGWLMMLI